VAFVHLVQWVTEWGYELIDCQVTTAHLKRFGAREIPRPIFLTLVRQGVETPSHPSAWNCFQGETPHD
jgi:leucyl/phenylalanyl-tRNA---protein transferase